MHDVMSATLMKYDTGDIDAVWVAYDAYAQGCYQALRESQRDIPLVSVDICNMDIQYMLEDDSQWKACACTDFKANGEQGIRILALELNNEYEDITDPETGEQTNYIEMPASLITQDMLRRYNDRNDLQCCSRRVRRCGKLCHERLAEGMHRVLGIWNSLHLRQRISVWIFRECGRWNMWILRSDPVRSGQWSEQTAPESQPL